MARILIVEDDPSTQKIYNQVLGDVAEVDTASDGEEGLLKARLGGYDIIFLDVMMPKLDGLALLTKLRENPPTTPNKKIILLTNLSNEPVINEAIALGVSSTITKSDITPGDLIEIANKELVSD
jgi:CheY-like chemotaxis protein